MGWQQDGAHGTAHRSPGRSLASNWPSRQIGGSIRGYPAGPSARWPARRAQSTIIAQADTLYSYALPTASRTRASAAVSMLSYRTVPDANRSRCRRVVGVVCGEQPLRSAQPPPLPHDLGHLIEINLATAHHVPPLAHRYRRVSGIVPLNPEP